MNYCTFLKLKLRAKHRFIRLMDGIDKEREQVYVLRQRERERSVSSIRQRDRQLVFFVDCRAAEYRNFATRSTRRKHATVTHNTCKRFITPTQCSGFAGSRRYAKTTSLSITEKHENRCAALLSSALINVRTT